MFRIGKQFRFVAGHTVEGLPADHKCARLHGHNYRVEVVLASPVLDETGFVWDFGELSQLQHWLDENWDHQLLNKVPPFVPQSSSESGVRLGIPTTAESMAMYLFGLVSDWGWPVSAVRVWETDRAWAEYKTG